MTSLWIDDECRYISYVRGSFSQDPSSVLCDVEGRPRPAAIDADAATDIERLRKTFASNDLPIRYLSVHWTDQGTVARDSFFSTDPCTSYNYEPGWTVLPPEEELIGAVAIALNDDWYLISNCT